MSPPRVAILDYGCGNLASVANAVRKVGGESFISRHGSDIWTSDAVILPGQGHFGQAAPAVHHWLDGVAPNGMPVLGICLGMQLMCEGSEEAPGVKGLGWIPGPCYRLPVSPLPHVGWNDVDGVSYYFCHTYAVGHVRGPVIRTTEYRGHQFVSEYRAGNLWAVQFHPEKSGRAGLALLAEFLRL